MQRYNPALLFTTAPHYRHIEATYIWFSQKGRRLFEIPATKWHHFRASPLGFTKEFQVCLITADQAPTLVIDAYAFRLYNPLAMPLFSRRPSTSMSAICRRAVLRLHRHSMA